MVMASDAVERMVKLQEVICRALAGTLTWLQAADIPGMHPRTVRRWGARYQAGERLALYDRRHGPSPRKAPAAAVVRISRADRSQCQNQTDISLVNNSGLSAYIARTWPSAPESTRDAAFGMKRRSATWAVISESMK